MNGTLVLTGANTYSGGTTVGGTDLASYFNPGNGNNANPGNLRQQSANRLELFDERRNAQ